MKIALDMNLPTSWVGFLQQEGFEAVHWSEVGDPRAADSVIMTWAHDNGFVVFSHDLDFSALLAARLTSYCRSPASRRTFATKASERKRPSARARSIIGATAGMRPAFLA